MVKWEWSDFDGECRVDTRLGLDKFFWLDTTVTAFQLCPFSSKRCHLQPVPYCTISFWYVHTYFLYLFFERGKRREKERERSINVREKHWSVASPMCPNWGLNMHPRLRPDRESNWQPFVLWDDAPTDWAAPVRAALTFQLHIPLKKKKKNNKAGLSWEEKTSIH